MATFAIVVSLYCSHCLLLLDVQRGTGGDTAYHAHTPGGQAEEGYNPYEHPKVREARLAARSLADQIDLQQLPGMDCGPPPERPLVCYDDL